MDSKIHTYKDLIVWQKAMDLVVAVYTFTEDFPKEELYGLTSQMRRCAVSIPSNIAEGRYRSTKKDFVNFLRIAYSSGAELETQVEISARLPKTKTLDTSLVGALLQEVMRMLNVMLRKLASQEAKS